MERAYLEAAALVRAGVKPDLVRNQLERQLTSESQASFWKIWDFALEVGAPLAETLEQQADIERAQRLAEASLAKMYAAPKSTFRLVAVLPVLALISSQIGGLNPFAVFRTSIIPWLSAALGIFLLAVAYLLTKRLLASSSPKRIGVSQMMRWFLVSATAGHSTARCLELASSQGESDASEAQELEHLRQLLNPIEGFGAAPVSLVRSEISLAFEREQNQQEIAIEKASVRLIAPAALLSMPAFALIALVPTAMSLAASLTG